MKNGAFGSIREENGEKRPKMKGREFTDRPPKMTANLPIAFKTPDYLPLNPRRNISRSVASGLPCLR